MVRMLRTYEKEQIAMLQWQVFILAFIKSLKLSGYYMYHLLYHAKTLHSAHRVYLCVPHGSHNKQRLFP
jgi:hypothetical protein